MFDVEQPEHGSIDCSTDYDRSNRGKSADKAGTGRAL
jgi:hypothetical protein